MQLEGSLLEHFRLQMYLFFHQKLEVQQGERTKYMISVPQRGKTEIKQRQMSHSQ